MRLHGEACETDYLTFQIKIQKNDQHMLLPFKTLGEDDS